ncbi:hypothetical protein ACHAPT_001929 [Fusarium lateritium]
MKSISLVLTLLLSSVLAAPFDSTYSSLSAREQAGFFNDLKGGSLGPRANDDALVARATADLDEFLASLGGHKKRDGEGLSKREEALLGELLGLVGGLTGGLTGGASGSAGVGGLTKGLTGTLGKTVGDLTGGVTGSAGVGGLTKDLTGKLGGLTGGVDAPGAVGGLTKGLTGKLGGLTGGLTGGQGGSADVKLGGKTGEHSHEIHTTHESHGPHDTDKKESDKQKREEAIAGLPLNIDQILALLGLGKRDEQDLSKREEAIAALNVDNVHALLGPGKRGQLDILASLDLLKNVPVVGDLLKSLGAKPSKPAPKPYKRDGQELSEREEALLGLENLPVVGGLLTSLGLRGEGDVKAYKRDAQELSEREIAGIGRILSLNLLPLLKGSGKRSEPNTELVDPINVDGAVAEGSPVERRGPAFVLPPKLIEELIRKEIEEAKKAKGNNNDKSEAASHHEATDDISDEEAKEIVAAILRTALSIPATDPIKVAAEDKAGEADKAAEDASGKAKEATTAVDPASA